MLVFEDGDRYVIRALCAFRVDGDVGIVRELLHDRSVAGMRAASHLLGIAVHAASDAGASTMRAWSLPTSGSYPIYALRAFRRADAHLRFGVRVLRDVGAAAAERERWYLSLLDA